MITSNQSLVLPKDFDLYKLTPRPFTVRVPIPTMSTKTSILLLTGEGILNYFHALKEGPANDYVSFGLRIDGVEMNMRVYNSQNMVIRSGLVNQSVNWQTALFESSLYFKNSLEIWAERRNSGTPKVLLTGLAHMF